jgi:hypothetical protein
MKSEMRNRLVLLIICVSASIFIFWCLYGYLFSFYEEHYSPTEKVPTFYLFQFFMATWPSVLLRVWPGQGLYSMAENYLKTDYIPPPVIWVNIAGWALLGCGVWLIMIFSWSRMKKRNQPNSP